MINNLPEHIIENILLNLKYNDIHNIKNTSSSLMHLINKKYTFKYVFLQYSLAYGDCGPIIINHYDLGTVWKTILTTEYKEPDLAYQLFDTRKIRLKLNNDSIELSVNDIRSSNILSDKIPELCMIPSDNVYMDEYTPQIYRFTISYKGFYNILSKLKYIMVYEYDDVFLTDDPFPSWHYLLEPILIKKGDQYLTAEYSSSRNNIKKLYAEAQYNYTTSMNKHDQSEDKDEYEDEDHFYYSSYKLDKLRTIDVI